MGNIIVVTNRKLSIEPFERRIERLVRLDINRIILREKDLSPTEYYFLAKKIIKICEEYGVNLMLHTHIGVARKLGHNKIHVPIAGIDEVKDFETVGSSCHFLSDAKKSEEAGADYITFGHVFETECKKGLAPRGLDKLSKVCRGISLPVYAIGGMTPNKYASVLNAGARGCCIMSSAMIDDNVEKLVKDFNNIEEKYRDGRKQI